jgi:hypothetical protein
LTDLDVETMELYAKQGWPLELLKDLCREAVRYLTSKTGITVYIDALDEGDVEDDVRDMVAFIEELTARTSTGNQPLRVCLASRHYPTISMHNVERLILEKFEDHNDDIATYVQAQLHIGNLALRAELVSTICARASEVFLWVVLVVKILNKEADRGHQHNIPAKLQELPTGLHDLFEKIIERDADNNQCFLSALIWALFSKGSLKPIELYFAVMFSTGQLGPKDMVWDSGLVDPTTVENFLISSSKGLVECVRKGHTTSVSSRVQIIHESVREYLFSDGLRKLDKDLNAAAEARCHWRLAKWNITYIQLAVETGLLGRSDQARSFRQCPLLEYAVEYALSHAETAARLGCRQPVHDIASVKMWNRFGYPGSDTTMLHLLVHRRHGRLVAIELERISKKPGRKRQVYLDTQYQSFRPVERPIPCNCTALGSAVALGEVNMVRALLESGACACIRCDHHGFPLDIARTHPETVMPEGEELSEPPIPTSERSQIVDLLCARLSASSASGYEQPHEEHGADVALPIRGRSFLTLAKIASRFGARNWNEKFTRNGAQSSDVDPDSALCFSKADSTG